MKRLPVCLFFALGTMLPASPRKSSLLKGVKKSSPKAENISIKTTEEKEPLSSIEKRVPTSEPVDSISSRSAAEQKSAAPAQKDCVLPKKQRTINLKTNISRENLGYNYLGTTYYPTFEIEANKAPCQAMQEKPLTIKNNKLSLSYLCEFKKWGISYHRERKTLKYSIPESMSTVNVEFSWNNKDEHIAVPGAQLIASKSIK